MSKRPEMRQLLFDGAVALLLVALNLLILLPLGRDSRLPLVAAAVVVHAGCLAWRRHTPLVVFAVNVATGLLVVALGYPPVVLGVASLVALYTAAAMAPRRRSVPAAVVLIAAMFVSQIIAEADIDTVIGNVVVLGVTWFFGDSVGQRRDYVRRLEERTAELEQARDELAQSAVVEERLRIARELHDILGHSVGVIAVQAGVGAHVIDSDPQEAKRSLQAIESVSKSTLGEIRQVLGALRDDGENGEVRPAPGIDDLSALIADLPAEQVTVEVDVDDAARSLPAGLQLTIFRVTQEALTNVIRHSGATVARVVVRARPDEVHLEIVDDGAGSTKPPGHGLLGMGERVAMQGGSFEAGSLQEKGFRVSATFPVSGAR